MPIQNSKLNIQNSAPFLILLLVLLDPILTIIFIPLCDSFIPPKIFALHIGLSVIALIWIIHIIRAEEIHICRSPLLIPVISYFAVHIISAFNASSGYLSLRQLEVFLPYFLIFLFALTYVNTENAARTLLRGIVLMGCLFSIHGIFQFAGLDFLGRQSRYYNSADVYLRTYSTFGNPDLLAEYLSVALMPAAGLLFSEKNRRWQAFHLVATAAIAICILLTKSRGAAVSAAVGFMILSILISHQKSSIFRRLLIAAGICILTATIILSLTLTKGVKSESVIYRIITWRIAAQMILEHPIAGIGTGNFHYLYLNYQREFFKNPDNLRYAHLVNNEKPRHLHNEYLQTAVETGVPGLAAFLLVLIVFLWHSVKLLMRHRENSLLIIAFCAALVFWLEMGVGVGLHIPPSGALFWLMLGMMSSGIGHGRILMRKLSFTHPRVKWEIAATAFILIAFFLVHSVRQIEANMLLAKGKELIAAEKAAEAIPVFDRALRLDPGRGEIHFQRGAAFLMIGNYEQAITEFYRAKKSSNDPNLHFNSALALFQVKQYDEAIKELKIMEEMIPAHPQPKITMSIFLRYLGREEEAKQKILEAKELQKSNW
ncbi:MAG: O-antigen ligase family protein [bacterium]